MRESHDCAEDRLPNGASAAAVLAAGIGCAALGLFEMLADAFKGIASFFHFIVLVGPVSGVTVSALAIWLAAWFTLASLWEGHEVRANRVAFAALVLLAVGLALTFPPFLYLVQGK